LSDKDQYLQSINHQRFYSMKQVNNKTLLQLKDF
jgi:hypothetical protein